MKRTRLENEIRQTQDMLKSKMRQRKKLDVKITLLAGKLRRLLQEKKEEDASG